LKQRYGSSSILSFCSNIMFDSIHNKQSCFDTIYLTGIKT
jgi:hypothetical protein